MWCTRTPTQLPYPCYAKAKNTARLPISEGSQLTAAVFVSLTGIYSGRSGPQQRQGRPCGRQEPPCADPGGICDCA